jgi:hypothetical protein
MSQEVTELPSNQKEILVQDPSLLPEIVFRYLNLCKMTANDQTKKYPESNPLFYHAILIKTTHFLKNITSTDYNTLLKWFESQHDEHTYRILTEIAHLACNSRSH